MPRHSALAVLALAAACGHADLGDDLDADSDALSATTFSMEMVRKNPALAPGVAAIESSYTKGRPAPGGERAARIVQPQPGSFLYAANQLDQFLKLADPAIHHDDQGNATYSRQPGDLYAEDARLKWDNVEQGHLGDCYFAAALSAVLFADKAGTLARSLIVPRTSGGKVVSYNAYFYQSSSRRVRIEVDPDLLHRTSNGRVLYMRSTDTKAGYEEWAPSLIEKAYAAWHGSYEAIGNGGYAGDAIYALTGKRTRFYTPRSSAVVSAIEAAGRGGRAQTACTFSENSGVKYDGTGVYADHCYSLRGVRRDGAKVFVQLRNPWGPIPAGGPEPTEPDGDGNPDGLFELQLATFQRLYASVDIVP